MATAICLTGYVRTFGVPSVYRGIEELRRQASWPGTGKGITVESANRRLNATESHDAYVLLDRKPWSAG
jgi:hypothetical protein